jgi:hypothetical protein
MLRPRTLRGMRKACAVAAAVLALSACGHAGQNPAATATTTTTSAEPQLVAPATWQPTDGGRARITDWRWEDSPPNSVGRPVHGTWLILDIEVQATELPLSVSLWDWRCLGAYDGVVAPAVATPLHSVLDVTLPAGVSAVGSVACDPNPEQATIVQWANPAAPQGPQPSWLVPAKETR